MKPDAVLITQPAIDFDTLLGISHEALGYSVSASADASHKQLSEPERFLSCLAAFKDAKQRAIFAPNLLRHVSFSVLIACAEGDLLEIMELTPSISYVTAETVARGVTLAVASGSLAAWRDGVIAGSKRYSSVSNLFNRIQSQFEAQGLNVWTDQEKRFVNPTQFLLEHKKR